MARMCPANSELHCAEEWVSGHPIREAAFANLNAPLQPVRAPIDPTDAREERNPYLGAVKLGVRGASRQARVVRSIEIGLKRSERFVPWP